MVCQQGTIFLALCSAASLVSAVPPPAAETPVVEQIAVPCNENLVCSHEAHCVEGIANFTVHLGVPADDEHQIPGADFLTVSHVNNQHCSCPIGWTGVNCNVKYESCDQQHPCL